MGIEKAEVQFRKCVTDWLARPVGLKDRQLMVRKRKDVGWLTGRWGLKVRSGKAKSELKESFFKPHGVSVANHEVAITI